MSKGLSQTASLWPDVRVAYDWVHRAAHLLGNSEKRTVQELRCAYECLLQEITSFDRSESDLLRGASGQFVKVSQSYGQGLFPCYGVPGLPPTNNALEQFFGSARYHERRASGRKSASPSLVVRGSVRLLAAVATRQGRLGVEELRPGNLANWRALRQELEQRHETRRQQRRFRRAPEAFLRAIEEQLLKPILPT